MANYKNLKVDAVITWVDGNDIEHRGKNVETPQK